MKQSGNIEIGKFKLSYRIEGTGTPAIVIGDVLYYPRTFSQNLRQHLQLIFINHRGFAVSSGEIQQDEYEFDVILDDIEFIRQKLGLDKVIIIGHSGHSFMALEYAKKYPQHVTHVAMLGSVPDFSIPAQEVGKQFWEDTASPERKQAFAENAKKMSAEDLPSLPADQQFIRHYVSIGPQIWYDYHYDSSPMWEGVAINMQIFNYIWGTVFRDIDITKGLDKFDLPVFVAAGKYDYPEPPQLWDPVKSKFKNLTMRIFDKSGHTPQLEEPELFDRELLTFLQR